MARKPFTTSAREPLWLFSSSTSAARMIPFQGRLRATFRSAVSIAAMEIFRRTLRVRKVCRPFVLVGTKTLPLRRANSVHVWSKHHPAADFLGSAGRPVTHSNALGNAGMEINVSFCSPPRLPPKSANLPFPPRASPGAAEMQGSRWAARSIHEEVFQRRAFMRSLRAKAMHVKNFEMKADRRP